MRRLILFFLTVTSLVNSKVISQSTLNPMPIEFRFKDNVAKRSVGSRILGGSIAAVGQFPWQALLYMDFETTTLFGGGALISTTRLLTAAHNWNSGGTIAQRMTAHLGSNTLGEGLQIVADKVIVHEDYNSGMGRNDLAMVFLPYAVGVTDRIQPVALPFGQEANEDFVGAAVVASGFGVTANGVTGRLNFANLQVISNQQCIQEFGVIGMFVEPSNICTSGRGGTGICSGDSGGPLVTYRNGKAVLVGISSFRLGGCYGDAPSAYARVTSFRSWIRYLI